MRWTMKETLKGKTVSVIILTIILTIAMNKLVNGLLTQEETIGEGLYSSRTIHFSIGIYGLIFVIPAGFISTLIMKFFMNKILSQSYASKGEISFKWYSLYGTVIGYIILFLLINLTNTYASQMLVSNIWDAIKYLAVLIIIPIIFAVISAKTINKVMIRITNTNRSLIEEILAGRYDAIFLNHGNKTRVLKLLKKGNVHTIKGGLLRLKILDILLMVRRIIIFVPLVLLNALIPNIGKLYHLTGGEDTGESNLDQQYQERKKLKSEADDTAEEKREQVNFSKRMFEKQANYNIKYSENEWNRAVRDERAYRDAKRKADSL